MFGDYLMEMFTGTLVGGLISSVPLLIGWTIAVILVSIMLKRGGGKAERFLLVGVLLMLLRSLIGVFDPSIAPWLIASREMTSVEIARILAIYGLIKGVIGLVGIVFLVYAFWIKFKSENSSFHSKASV
jgi:hypothetical protein